MDSTSTLIATLQLADSFFPSGLYTQSHGLESFVAAGVRGEAALTELVRVYLRQLVGSGEALAARWAARAALAGDLALVTQIDARLHATKLAAEPRLASTRCGGRLVQLGAEVFGGPLSAYAALVAAGDAAGHQAVVLALIGVASGLDAETAAAVECSTFATSLVSAAVRLGALDHVEAQRLLRTINPEITAAAQAGRERDWRAIGGFAPQIELMQLRHRTDELHMFVS